MITLRCWFGFFAAVALRREQWGDALACDLGMPHLRGHYGFGAEVGRA